MSDAAIEGSGIIDTGTGDARRREEEIARVRDAARHLGVDSLRDGSWFRKIVAAHVKKHAAEVRAEHWDEVYAELDVERRAHEHIKRVALKTVATGLAASALSSVGELASYFSEGLAAPVGIPATVLSIVVEAAYTSLLQIDLACDLASIYGVPFDPEDVGEVATLFALALEVDVKYESHEAAPAENEDAEQPRGLTTRLMELEEGEIAKRIGRKLLEDAILKNVMPVVGMAISARWNWVGTRKLGAAVRRYVRYRRALVRTLERLDLSRIVDPGVLVQGAWLLATVDGEAAHEELMAVALVVDRLPEERRRALPLDRTLDENEEEWFEALRRVPRDMHEPLLDVLYLIAATDKRLGTSEKRFLRRVARTLSLDLDVERVEAICRHLASGEDLPQGVLHCVRTSSTAAAQ